MTADCADLRNRRCIWPRLFFVVCCHRTQANPCHITGKCFLDMLGVFAEFETNLRRERQLEGIAKAKAAGIRLR
jgi:DNA invertase Pin-like site-specific DNA recombinase